MDNITRTIKPLLEQYGVKKAALFGSYARGESDEKSDIDLLIEPPEGMGLGFVRLKRDLEELLQKKVDLVSYNGLSPHLKESILQHERRII